MQKRNKKRGFQPLFLCIFGDFYQYLVNSPTAQNQLGAFDTLFSFYYSLSFDCSSGSNPTNE